VRRRGVDGAGHDGGRSTASARLAVSRVKSWIGIWIRAEASSCSLNVAHVNVTLPSDPQPQATY
jgi:hypothetical protein